MSTTPKLDELITFYEWGKNELLASAYREIRDHLQRWSPKEPTRYPSEAETRLIEALERAQQLLQTRCYKTALELVELTLKSVPPES